MLRCSECKKDIIKSTKYMDWLSLYNFLEFLFNEQYIEAETYHAMVDRLMSFKFYCEEDEEAL